MIWFALAVFLMTTHFLTYLSGVRAGREAEQEEMLARHMKVEFAAQQAVAKKCAYCGAEEGHLNTCPFAEVNWG